MTATTNADESNGDNDKCTSSQVVVGELLTVDEVEDDGSEDYSAAENDRNDSVVDAGLAAKVEGLQQSELDSQLEESSRQHSVGLHTAELVLLCSRWRLRDNQALATHPRVDMGLLLDVSVFCHSGRRRLRLQR